eukprot:scaffold257_cov241-Pinguiococcus_pyrenoidosus.AAC.12
MSDASRNSACRDPSSHWAADFFQPFASSPPVATTQQEGPKDFEGEGVHVYQPSRLRCTEQV